MKRKVVIGIVLIFILCFVSACAPVSVEESNGVETLVEIENVESVILDVNDANDKVELDTFKIEDTDTQVNPEYNSILTLCKLLEDSTNLVVDLEYYEENYFDDYEGIIMDEAGNIVLKDENNFPVLYVYASFIEGKVHNMSVTLNMQENGQVFAYSGLLQDIFKTYLTQNEVSTTGQKEYVNSLMNFDLYELNIYDNLELNILIEDCYGLGVVFEGGKDLEFEGTTYYYSVDYPI